MFWPSQIVSILNRGDDEVSRALRASLESMRRSLERALDSDATGVCDTDAQKLLIELETLLQGSMRGSREPASSHPASANAPLDRLRAAVASMIQDVAFVAEAGGRPILGDTSDALWNSANLRLLRVTSGLADRWRSTMSESLRECGVVTSYRNARQIPFPNDIEIYPGLEGGLSALGLTACSSLPIDDRLGSAPADPELASMARIVSTVLSFIEIDPDLHHCLLSVYRFGIVPLAGEQKTRYVDELLRRWRRLRVHHDNNSPVGTGPNIKQCLIDWIELDEALNSLTYDPPPAVNSWWGRLLGEARLALFRARDRALQAGCQVRLQRLAGPFAAISGLTGNDNLHVERGTPGEVVACLRVFAKLDGEEYKARVLYRSH